MSTVIYINGVDRTNEIPWRELGFSHGMGRQQSELVFSMHNVTNFPANGDFVEVWEDTTLLFAGLIETGDMHSPIPRKTTTQTVLNWFTIMMNEYVRTTYINKTFHEIVEDILKEKIYPDTLKVMFQFEEGSGTLLNDKTQFGFNGTLAGGYTWNSDQSVSLDGASGTYISVDDVGALDFNNVFSLCFEGTIDTLGRTIIQKDLGGSSDHPYKVSVDANGAVVLSVYDGTTNHSIQTANGVITTGTKKSIICQFDRSVGKGYIYVDGLLVKEDTLTNNVLENSTGNLLIGETSGDSFDGTVNRISIYGSVLNSIECRRWHVDCLEVKAPARLMQQGDILIDRITFSFSYPAECLSQLAQMIGVEWFMDSKAFIYTKDLVGGTVSHTFNESDGTMIKGSTTVNKSIVDIRNVIIVRGGVYYGDWRLDVLKSNGSNTVFSLPYKYSGFELFTDTPSLAGDVQSWYKMNDASSNLTDEKSNNTITPTNVSYSQSGKIGDSIGFNGTTSTARKTSATHQTGDTPHAITIWAKPDVHDTTERVLAGFGDFSAGHSKLSLIQSSGTYYLRHNFGDSIVNDVEIGDASGAFHLFGMSYDEETAGGAQLKVFFDGVLKDTIVVENVDIDAGVVEIGGNNGSNVFDGDIDEVTYFNYALTEQEHEAIFNIASTSISAILLNSGVEFLQEPADFDGLYNFNEKNYSFETAPADGVILYPTGKPEILVQSIRTNSNSIAQYGRKELEINDPSLESQSTARSLANAELSRRKNPTESIEFATYKEGVEPGQTILVEGASFNIPSSKFFVNKVETVPYLPVETNNKKWQYRITCSTTVAKNWIDFLRDAFKQNSNKEDVGEGEAVEDITEHTEEIELNDVHTIVAPVVHTETIECADSHVLNEVVSGEYKWSNDAGTTVDKLRWGVGDWG